MYLWNFPFALQAILSVLEIFLNTYRLSVGEGLRVVVVIKKTSKLYKVWWSLWFKESRFWQGVKAKITLRGLVLFVLLE